MSQAKADCEELLNAAMPFAVQMLERDGEFFPFGNAMQSDGKIVAVGGYDGREHPHSAELMRLIKAGFVEAARRSEYRATALVYDVRVKAPSNGDSSDAIAVSLNHRDQYSVIVLFPYWLTEGKLVIDTPFAHAGEADIFVPK